MKKNYLIYPLLTSYNLLFLKWEVYVQKCFPQYKLPHHISFLTDFGQRAECSLQHLESAPHFWNKVVGITRPIYKDMPLASYNYLHEGNESEIDNSRRFHWDKLRSEEARNAVVNPGK